MNKRYQLIPKQEECHMQNEGLYNNFQHISPEKHMCLLYRNEEERGNIIFNFLKGEFLHHEKVIYFSDLNTPGQIRNWL